MDVARIRGSLQRRIVASVLLGLAVVLVGIASLVGLAVTQSLRAALAERLAVAYAKEHEVDQEIGDALSALARIAAMQPSPTAGGAFRALTARLGVTGEFSAHAIVDPQGAVVYQAGPTGTGGGDPPPWLPAPARLRSLLAAQRPVVFGGQGRPLLVLAAPLSGAGERRWLVAAMDSQRLVRHLTAEHSVHGAYEAELLTEAGSVAAGFPRSGGVSAHAALVGRLAGRREAGVVLHRVRGGAGDHYVAYVPLQAVQGWGVIVEQPRDIVVALPRRLWRWMMGIGVFVLLAGAVVAWSDVRRVVMPLRRLAALAERFGRGDLEARVPVDREDEIGLLGRTLEEMRSRLRASLEEIGRREARAQALYRLSTQLLTPADRESVLQRIATEAREQLGGDVAVLCLRGTSALTVTAGWPADRPAPGATCTCGDPPAACPLLPAELSGARLSAPVFTGSTRLGQFCVARRAPAPFTDEDQALLSGLSNLAALTIENARLQAEVRSLSALTERERIARELHDGLAQALGIIYAQAKAAGEHVSASAGPAGAALREIAEISAQAYEEVRQSIFGLRTMVARRLGLVPALTEYLHEFSEHTKVRVELIVPDTFPRLPLEVEAQLIRVVQEALTNVWRHARAHRAWVRFAVEGGRVHVVVEDDGVGFDWAAVVAADVRRFGLEAMRERAESIGGSLQIDSAPGRGTRVSLALPLAGRG